MRVYAVAFIALAVPVSSLAQTHDELRRSLPELPASAFPASVNSGPRSATVLDRVLRLAGGALAGAWMGYMASQVVASDWEDRPGIDRGDWAAGGAAFGVAVGLTLPLGAPGRSDSRAEDAGDRDILTTRELREAEGGSLYEVIQSLRPEWLRTRGTASIRETARGRTTGPDPDDVVVQPGIPRIRVYLDDSHLGGVEQLRTIQPVAVGLVRFLDSAAATQRWGAGHLHGAILVITAPVR